MSEISAAENHTIQTAERRWRLLYNDRPMAEANSEGFRYGNRFGTTRRLNESGSLQRQDILQVVLGWQQSDEAWHLGFILNANLATERGSRWCELVYWPDPDRVVFQDLAEETGRYLAEVLGVNFYLIPAQPTEAVRPIRQLPLLPLQFGLWKMDALVAGKPVYELTLASKWMFRRYSRAAWYGFWAVIYLVLSIGTLNSDIALPNAGTLIPDPQMLPYLGIGICFLLIGLMLYQISVALRFPNRIVIDGTEGTIGAWRGKNLRWILQRQELQSLYVSEMVKKREKAPATEYGELNFHLGGGKFYFVLAHDEPEENRNTPQPSHIQQNKDELQELTKDDFYTALQAAALYIAEALGDMSVWYDLRFK